MAAPIKRTQHDIYASIDPAGRLAGSCVGKTILITGAGTGCGQSMAYAFGQAGASTIILTGRTPATLETTKAELNRRFPTCRALILTADVTQDGSVSALFESLKAEHTIPDVLINNSGVNLVEQRIADSDPLQWWATVEVSLKGTYLMTRAYLRHVGLTEGSDTGSAVGGAATTNGPARYIILNLSSGAADVLSPTMSAYGTAKQAVNRFTEMLQHEYGSRGVRSIAMTPGGVRATGMGARVPPQFANRLLDSVELCGGFAVYLTTERAKFLAGRFANCNWDVDMLEEVGEDVTKENLLVARLRYGAGISDELVGLDGGSVGFMKAKGE